MKELEKALRKTFVDYRLSKDEKYAFRDLLQAYRDDVDILSFVPNTAFDIAGDRMDSSRVIYLLNERVASIGL